MTDTDITFFDVNVLLGNHFNPFAPNPFTIRHVREEYDRLGFSHRALVSHLAARDHGPMEANRRIVVEIGPETIYEPVWTVMPHQTGEIGNPKDILEDLERSNVKAVRTFPENRQYPFTVWAFGEVLSILQEYQIPLLVDAFQANWDNLNSICEEFMGLPIILTGCGASDVRFLYALLDRHHNLRFEISRFNIHQGLEDICYKFGAERVLFGSGIPYSAPGPGINMILKADIPNEDKELIANGNIRRLLDAVKSE